MWLRWCRKSGEANGRWEYGVDVSAWAVAAIILAAWWWFTR